MTSLRFDKLSKDDLKENPFEQFSDWFELAKKHVPLYPEAMSLSTINNEGYPSSRYVLLRGFKVPYFQFFTNYNSQKGQDLSSNPKACLLFFWKDLGKQIRIWGDISKSSKADSDDYWKTRPLESQIHAVASNQSHEVKSFNDFLNEIHRLEKLYKDKTLPRPENWGGFDLKPEKFEFWQEGEFRLHRRFQYSKMSPSVWKITELYP